MKPKQLKSSVWRQCGRKKRYKDEHEAGYVCKQCEKRRGQKLDYYYCGYCNGWHLTSEYDSTAMKKASNV